jgi:hypothetical protein
VPWCHRGRREAREECNARIVESVCTYACVDKGVVIVECGVWSVEGGNVRAMRGGVTMWTRAIVEWCEVSASRIPPSLNAFTSPEHSEPTRASLRESSALDAWMPCSVQRLAESLWHVSNLSRIRIAIATKLWVTFIFTLLSSHSALVAWRTTRRFLTCIPFDVKITLHKKQRSLATVPSPRMHTRYSQLPLRVKSHLHPDFDHIGR